MHSWELQIHQLHKKVVFSQPPYFDKTDHAGFQRATRPMIYDWETPDVASSKASITQRVWDEYVDNRKGFIIKPCVSRPRWWQSILIFCINVYYRPHLPMGERRRPRARAKKLSKSQIARLCHEGSREADRKLHTTTFVNRWHVVWIHAWTKPNWFHTHFVPATRKYHAVNKTLYMAFADQEKAFDRVPRRVIWSGRLFASLALWSGWCAPYRTCINTRTRMRVGCNQSEKFSVKVGVHKGPAWAPYCSSRFWKPYSTTEGMTSGQHGQNQCPYNWFGTRLSSAVWQRPLCLVPLGCRYKFQLLWGWFPLDPHDIQWYLWHSSTLYSTDQSSRWQINDRVHNGRGEAWVGAIILLKYGLLIIGWQLWNRFHQNMPCRMGKFKELLSICTTHPFPLPPEEEFTIHASGAPCPGHPRHWP